MQAPQSNTASDILGLGLKRSPALSADIRQTLPSSLESHREQDQRLEHSLYDGQSIEVGWDFEGLHGTDVHADLGVQSASVMDGDGSEHLFHYAAAAPAPDPEAIRGAISRLARESQSRREQRSNTSDDPGKHAGSTEAASSTKGSDGLTGSAGWGSGPAKPLDFGDVARRVWKASVSLPDLAPAENELSSLPQDAATALPDGKPAVATDPVQRPQAACATELLDVEAEPALAHDACNLLSAMTLYSELLGSPGVLQTSYLRYADELKLLAVRSQVLIDRLLQVAAEPRRRPAALADRETAGQSVAMPERQPPADFTTQPGSLLGPAISGGVMRDEVEATSLADILMRWTGSLSTMAEGALEVVHGPGWTTPVPVAAEAVERILVNLVRNARTATLEGGAIRIGVSVQAAGLTLESGSKIAGTRPEAAGLPEESATIANRTGSAMVLTVDDSGCGMTESQIRKILGEDTRFARAAGLQPDRSRVHRDDLLDGDAPQSEGEDLEYRVPIDVGSEDVHLGQDGRRRGLGLQIVRRLVAASGGTFAIQSRIGRGTRVEIRWPIPSASVSSAAEKEEELHRMKQPSDTDPAGSSTIHVVQPIAPETAPEIAPKTSPVASSPAKAGPDGFSEPDLRAMMLRLHRAGPQERSPFSRRLRTGAAATPAAGRSAVAGCASESPQGPGASTQNRSAPDRNAEDRGFKIRSVSGDLATKEEMTKGAIAC